MTWSAYCRASMNFTIAAKRFRQSASQAIDDGETKSEATPPEETITSFGWAFLHQLAGFNPIRRMNARRDDYVVRVGVPPPVGGIQPNPQNDQGVGITRKFIG